MMEYLFIVIGKTFIEAKRYLGLPEDTAMAEIALSENAMLVALKDDLRWDGVRPKIIRVLKEKPARQAFVIVHKWCCNGLGWYKESNLDPHLRLPRGEAHLRAELDKESARYPEGLEVFGIHFEPGNSLADALELVRQSPRDFASKVIKVLDSSDPTTLFDKISVVKHRIIGLFLPLDLTLQNWAEQKDPQLREEVDSRLCGKLEGARRLVEEVRRSIEEGGRQVDLGKVQALLEPTQVQNGAREAAAFHAWINLLDQALDEVRRVVVS